MSALIADLVQQLVNRFSDARLPLDISQSEIRLGDEPAFCRDLVLDEVVFRPGISNARPAFPRRVDDVQIVRDQSNEVVDIDVLIAVERSGEKHSRVVVEKHEAHVMESSDFGCTGREVATQQLEERA